MHAPAGRMTFRRVNEGRMGAHMAGERPIEGMQIDESCRRVDLCLSDETVEVDQLACCRFFTELVQQQCLGREHVAFRWIRRKIALAYLERFPVRALGCLYFHPEHVGPDCRRGQVYRALELSIGFDPKTLRDKGASISQAGRRQLAIELDGPLVGRASLVRSTQALQDLPQKRIPLRRIRPSGRCFIQRLERFIEPAELG